MAWRPTALQQPEHPAHCDRQQPGDCRGSVARGLGAGRQGQRKGQGFRSAVGQIRQGRCSRQQRHGRQHGEQAGQRGHADEHRAEQTGRFLGDGRARGSRPAEERHAEQPHRRHDGQAGRQRGQRGDDGDHKLQAVRADAGGAQQRLEQQPEAREPEAGWQHGDTEQARQGAGPGNRHAVDHASQPIEPARPCRGFHRAAHSSNSVRHST